MYNPMLLEREFFYQTSYAFFFFLLSENECLLGAHNCKKGMTSLAFLIEW